MAHWTVGRPRKERKEPANCRTGECAADDNVRVDFRHRIEGASAGKLNQCGLHEVLLKEGAEQGSLWIAGRTMCNLVEAQAVQEVPCVV